MKKLIYILLFLLTGNLSLKAQSLIHSTISNGGTVSNSSNLSGSTLGEYSVNTVSISGATFYHGFQFLLDEGGGSGSGYPLCLNVTTSNPSGPGSLRSAIGCAFNGDIITFDSNITGNYIYLDQPTIVCNKDLTFSNTNNQFLRNINVSNSLSLMNISKSLTFEGLGIQGTSDVAMQLKIIGNGTIEMNNSEISNATIEN